MIQEILLAVLGGVGALIMFLLSQIMSSITEIKDEVKELRSFDARIKAVEVRIDTCRRNNNCQ